jgi:carboxylesterase type B
LSDISAPGAGGLLTNPQQAAEIRALAQSMSSAWVNFARTGNPNGPQVPPWPAYDLSTRPTMAWRNDEQGRITSTTINDLDSSRRTAWAAFDFGQLQGGPVAARSQARPTAR